MNGFVAHDVGEKDFLYSVLNLPTSASEHEVRERYRSLSIIFHPDKQHGDESSKSTAEKRFLEIQKAYEVLSDPFMREVYDVLGNEGLDMKWSDFLRAKPLDEVRNILRHTRNDLEQQKLEDQIRPRGKLTCALDATSLFDDSEDLVNAPFHKRLLRRFQGVSVASTDLSHDVMHRLNDKIRLQLAAQINTTTTERGVVAGSNILGTIRYQFSPRWTFNAATSLFGPHNIDLKASFRDDETACLFQLQLPLDRLPVFPPPITASVSRRLFRDSAAESALTVTSGPYPSLSLSLVVPSIFDGYDSPQSHTDSFDIEPGSESGFSTVAAYSSYSLVLADSDPGLKAEWGVAFYELALHLKLGLELGLTGLGFALTGSWTHDKSEIATSVGLSQFGVQLKIDLAYVGQRMSIPIVLTGEYDMGIALWTAVLPSTAFVLGYHFILKPWHREQRAAYFKAARKAMEDEKSHIRREFEETNTLLKETAKKHMQAETSKEGLVVLEATYGPIDRDKDANDLVLDVTVPLQALVHHSQLYIPGHRTKSGLQGFYDPAPGCLKVLRVRYNFRGRIHYAEVTDFMPFVLPLADHLVV